ncbi:MAG: hypothetical protein A2W80_17585 [Candidatus Riflebacteria bacterium GWC2_50_8]|nr:MAG: hypothetical protein A2W80_17585 [Candidatus Riflebacteria bacterium GWC2_50_8]
MKKCCLYLDALENKSSEDAAIWQDVLMHASRCPDCSTDMKRRSEMLELMAEMPEPAYPAVLHSAIMANIEDAGRAADSETEPGWLARLFDRMLQPVELAVSLACLIMFVFLMQLDHQQQPGIRPVRSLSLAVKPLAAGNEPHQSVAKQPLATVSAAEVDQFLRQLEDFNRTHPAQRQPQIGFTPELRLVNDLPTRR